MTVDPASAAASWSYRGTEDYFCHPGCQQRFQANPESFLQRPQPVPVQLQFGKPRKTPPPAASKRAGMTYTCPMHPEIVRDAPGPCPICGMALEPRTVTTE